MCLGVWGYLPRFHILEPGNIVEQFLIALATNTNPDILLQIQTLSQKFSVGLRTSLRLSGHENWLLDTLNLANLVMDLKMGKIKEIKFLHCHHPQHCIEMGCLMGEDSLNFMIFPGPATWWLRNGKVPQIESTNAKAGELKTPYAFRPPRRNTPTFLTYMAHFIKMSLISLKRVIRD